MQYVKRILTFTLALMMTLEMLPFTAFATEEETAPVEMAESITESDGGAEQEAESVSFDTEQSAQQNAQEQSDLPRPELIVEDVAEEVTEVVPDPSWDNGDNEELFREYADKMLAPNKGGLKLRALKKGASSRLTGNTALIYGILKDYIVEVASGERTSTVFEITLKDLGLDDVAWSASDLGVESLLMWNSDEEKWQINPDAMQAVSQKLAFDLTVLTRVLASEYPCELYWYDKTINTTSRATKYQVRVEQDPVSEEYRLSISLKGALYTLYFPVASEFSAGDYTVNDTYGATVQTVKTKAQGIVDTFKSSSDYDKLVNYRKEICRLVSYNRSVDDSTAYGNPWQLLWVFDDDTTTNVVCEGYAKAFQYLCDLTEFAEDVTCITVTGQMAGTFGSGGHMWNVVKMSDGRNYLVDVTNCDAGTIGADAQLFLTGYASGDFDGGYEFKCTSGWITYQYDESTRSIFDQDELELSEKAYVYQPTENHQLTFVSANKADCTNAGNIEYWTCSQCGKLFSDDKGTKEISAEATVVPALGHSWNAGEVTTEPTYTTEGVKTYTCTRCNETKTETIAKLKPVTLKDTHVTISTTIFVYDGKEKKPAVTVVVDGNTLINGTDYTVAYANCKNAGTASVTITGTGSYTGMVTKTYTIAKANQALTVSAPASVVKGKTVNITAKGIGTVTYKADKTKIATVSGKGVVKGLAPGTVTITVKAAEDKNYNAATKTVKITVYACANPAISKVQIVNGGMKLTWGKVAGAVKYRIFYKTGKGGWTKLADTTATTYTWKKAQNGATYAFTVRCISKDGKSYTSDFNKTGKSLTYVAVPTLSSVKNSKAKTMTAAWKKLGGVTGYQIQYSTNQNFKSGNKAVTVKKAASVAQAIKGLTKGKTYYVRIRSYKTVSGKNYFSAWSAAKAVKIVK